MNFKSVTINLLLTTLSAGVLLQTLEAQAASITFDPWIYTPPTVTTTNFANGYGSSSPLTLKAFAEATSTDLEESRPPQSARTIISLTNFFTVTPETGEQNGDQVRGIFSGSLQGVIGARLVDGGDVIPVNRGSVIASVNFAGFFMRPILSVGSAPRLLPVNVPINQERILTIGERYQLNMRLEISAETVRGNSQVYSDFASEDRGLTLNVRAEPVPEPLTMLASATALGFGAFFKREHSKNQKKC
jgi:hypothetical protein